MKISVSQLWNRYREINGDAFPEPPVSFHFCDNQEDADLCAALVVAGQKRATASSVAELQLAGDAIPEAGDYAVITNWSGCAVAIIRTTSVEIRRFSEVDEAFASAEGEGDLTLKWWRAAHQAYYERILAGSRYTVDADLEIVCERFELVFKA